MMPELCEAYRQLQAGKRHARFETREFLDIRVQLPDEARVAEMEDRITAERGRILEIRRREAEIRASIDGLFRGAISVPK